MRPPSASTRSACAARSRRATRGSARAKSHTLRTSASAGFISTVRDLLVYSMALDDATLLDDASRALAFTPVQTTGGGTSPYGLGWFSTMNRGTRVVWHYGYWIGNSSLIVRVPAQRATLVLLANSDGLCRRFSLGAGELESSPFAAAFLDWLGE